MSFERFGLTTTAEPAAAKYKRDIHTLISAFMYTLCFWLNDTNRCPKLKPLLLAYQLIKKTFQHD